MCYKFICLFLIYCISTARSQVTTGWVTQKLNNFNLSSTPLWLNRYHINEEFARPNGPLFILVNSGSDAIDLQWLTSGLMYDVAFINNGALLSLEPRFYGESRPTIDTSVESLQFLSHDQILNDLGSFIQFFKNNNSNYTNSKVILWGDAFGATYAVWMKQKFPELIDGVWASNSRVLSVFPSYPEYYNHFADTLIAIGGSDCFIQLQNTWRDIDNLISDHNTGEIERELLLCFPIDTNNRLDIALFVGFLIETIDKALRRSNSTYINHFCSILTDESHSSNINALGAWLRSEFRGDGCVMVSYQAIFPSLQSTSWYTITTQPTGLRQWYWQICSEFATFRTTESSFQPFPNRLPAILFHDVCKILFGNEFTPTRIGAGSEIVNSRFGGLQPPVANVYFTSSALNSFRFLAPLQDLNLHSPSDMYPEGQLNDLRSIRISDSTQLLRIKLRVYELVAKWIQR